MKKQKHYFTIGLFVLTALLLVVLAGILFGGGKLFTEKIYFETYFDTSVQGLEKGSLVQLRGVSIGQVESISFAAADYSNDLKGASHKDRLALRYVRVVCSINVTKHPNFSTDRLVALRDQAGLCASLTMQGITGGMLLNLDFKDNPAEHLKFAWSPKEIYLPSRPTTLENIISVSEKIASNLEKIDFSEMVDAITHLTTRLTAAVEDANIDHLSETVSACALSIETFVTRLDTLLIAMDPQGTGEHFKSISQALASVSEELKQTMPTLAGNTNATLESTKTSLDSLNTLLASLTPLVQSFAEDGAMDELPLEISDAMQQLTQTLNVLEAFINSLRERPSRLIFDDEE